MGIQPANDLPLTSTEIMAFSLPNLPDILIQIFERLENDIVSLQNACQVKRTWFKEAINVLWREAPVAALIDVKPSRRQIYSSNLLSLTFKSKKDGEYHESLRSLTFPRLKRLSANCDYSDEVGKVHFDQYFQPQLESIACYSGNLAKTLLDYTSTELPKLREILIDIIPETVHASRFLKFLRNHPSITSMVFLYNMEHVITDKTLIHLMKRQTLAELRLTYLLSKAMIEDALTWSSPPFRDIRYLEICVESKTVSSLVRAISSGPIEELTLYITDDNGSFLDHVSSLTQLRSLEIAYRQPRNIPQEEMINLRRLSQLRSLKLWYASYLRKRVLSSDAKDEDIRHLTVHLRKLRTFVFLVQCNLSIDTIVAIGKNCSELEQLRILGPYKLLELEHTGEVLFPVLKELELGKVRVDDLRDL